MRNQLPDSAHQAQVILGAWLSGDTRRFCRELDRVESAAADTAKPDESERMELLCAIAADLRNVSLQPAVEDAGNVYRTLLRHLAFSRPTAQLATIQ